MSDKVMVTWEEEVKVWQPLRLAGIKLGVLAVGLTVGILCAEEFINVSGNLALWFLGMSAIFTPKWLDGVVC